MKEAQHTRNHASVQTDRARDGREREHVLARSYTRLCSFVRHGLAPALNSMNKQLILGGNNAALQEAGDASAVLNFLNEAHASIQLALSLLDAQLEEACLAGLNEELQWSEQAVLALSFT